MKLLRKLFFLMLLYIKLTHGYLYTICALKKYSDTCDQLIKYDRIKCVYVENEASCLTKIDSGEIDFGSISAETAFLGYRFTSNVIPIAQTKPETSKSDFQYETVIVSKEKDFTSFKGMSYCHPGFNEMDMTPPFILKEFEQYVFKKDLSLCETKFETSIEWEVFALNKTFGTSCIPGRWTVDKKLNKELHDRYRKLTELCQNLNKNPFEQSLRCMLNNKNSISLTTLNTINKIIAENPALPLYYYCKNGTILEEPCVWSRQPYQFLVINNKKKQLENEIKKWFTDEGEREMEIRYIKTILEVIVTDFQMRFLFNGNFENVIYNSRDIPSFDNSDIKNCREKMKWCTISDEEQTKCKWLSQASINYGIQPGVDCIRKSDKLECIKAISEKSADLTTTSADFGYKARKFGLSPIAFPEIMKNQEINILLLVKFETITKLEDLKGKRGCFPSYGGIAWVSFAEIITKTSTKCKYGNFLNDYLGDSCMPGVSKSKLPKMCKLCEDAGKSCEAFPSIETYFNTSGALRCLDDIGDFAVVVEESSLELPNKVKVLCKDNTLTTLDKLDNNCYLSTTLTTSEILTRTNDSLNRDIQLALMQYDEWFNIKTRNTPFKLFESFNGTENLLFKDSTPGLELPSSMKKSIKNYVNLFNHIDHCKNLIALEHPDYGPASIAFVTKTLLIFTAVIVNVFS